MLTYSALVIASTATVFTCSGDRMNTEAIMVTMPTAADAGSNRRARAPQKRRRLTVPEAPASRQSIPVIRNPEMMKNTSTPTKPLLTPGTAAWNRTTEVTAIARNPSMSGRNFEGAFDPVAAELPDAGEGTDCPESSRPVSTASPLLPSDRRAGRKPAGQTLPGVTAGIGVLIDPSGVPVRDGQTVKPSARNCSRPSSVILSGPHGGFQTQLIFIPLTRPVPTNALRV